jgi:hypothetical protein
MINGNTHMNGTTTGLTETLLETLDVHTFLTGLREFDAVTQRQCLLKARKELLRPRTIGLHGVEPTKEAMNAIRNALAAMPERILTPGP